MVLLAVALSALAYGTLPAQSPAKPNILIILMDDMGWSDVSFRGGAISTPNIDRIAAEGAQLERFYVHNVCSPSRVALMTGKYPGRLGMTNGAIGPERYDGLPPEEFILPELLEQQGYSQRACIGKWHLGHSNIKYHPLRQGFSYFYGNYGGMLDYFVHRRRGKIDWHRNYKHCGDKGYTTELLANEAVRFIEDRDEASPFLLYMPFQAPHMPLQSTEQHLEQNGYDMSKGIYSDPSNENLDLQGRMPVKRKAREVGQGNSRRQTYGAMMTAADESIGRVLDCLKREGIEDNTIVIFFSDNGGWPIWGADNTPLRGGKLTNFEGGVRVPAAIRWPSVIPAGTKVNQLLAHVDIMPTLAAVSEAKARGDWDGQNMLPTILGDSSDEERILFLGKEGGGAIVGKRWKLLGDQLFDLENDASEKENVAGKFPDVFQEMSELRDQLMKEIEQPTIAREGFKLRENWEMPQ